MAYNNVLGITMGVVASIPGTIFFSNVRSNVFAFDSSSYVSGNPISFQSIRNVGFVLTTDAPLCVYSPNTHAWAPFPIACDPSTIVTSVLGDGTYVASLSNLPSEAYTDSNIAVGNASNTVNQWLNVVSLQTNVGTVPSFNVSSLNVSTINGVPTGQGYADTTTWQYNYVNSNGIYNEGTIFAPTTTSNIGYIVHRPYAPITYFNMMYNGTQGDNYTVEFCEGACTNSYTFSNVTGSPEIFESTIIPFTTVSSQFMSIVLTTGANPVTLYSFSLGYN